MFTPVVYFAGNLPQPKSYFSYNGSGEKIKFPAEPFSGHLWINFTNYLINWSCPVLNYYPECTECSGPFFILIGTVSNLGRLYTFCIRSVEYSRPKCQPGEFQTRSALSRWGMRQCKPPHGGLSFPLSSSTIHQRNDLNFLPNFPLLIDSLWNLMWKSSA